MPGGTYVFNSVDVGPKFMLDEPQEKKPGVFTFEIYNEDDVRSVSALVNGSVPQGTPVTFSRECVQRLRKFGYIQDQRKPLRFKYDAQVRRFQYEQNQPASIVFHPAQVEYAEFEIMNIDKRLDNEEDRKIDAAYGASIAAVPEFNPDGSRNFRKIYYPEVLLTDQGLNHIKTYYTLSGNMAEFRDCVTSQVHPLIFMHMRRLIPKSPHCTALRGVTVSVNTISTYFRKRYAKLHDKYTKHTPPADKGDHEDTQSNDDEDDRPAARTTSARTERAKAIKAAKAAAKAATEAAKAIAKLSLDETTTKPTLNETAFAKEALLPEPQLTPEEIEAARIAKEQEEIELERKEFEERQAKYAEHCAAAARQERLEREEKRAAAEERRRAKDAAASVAAEAAARAREEAARAREAARQEKRHGKKRN